MVMTCFPICLRIATLAISKCCRLWDSPSRIRLELDLGEAYRGGPLWLLMHGEIEYYSATSMYAADQARLRPIAPYVEALVLRRRVRLAKPERGKGNGFAWSMTWDSRRAERAL